MAPTSENIRIGEYRYPDTLPHPIQGKGLVSRLATIDQIEVCTLSGRDKF